MGSLQGPRTARWAMVEHYLVLSCTRACVRFLNSMEPEALWHRFPQKALGDAVSLHLIS